MAGALGLSATLVGLAAPLTAASAAAPTSLQITSATTGTNGLADGAIKHVWLIILENKSYDASFTGLNKNSYLWQTLPQQGVLLKNYYGTSHYSQGNYESLVSGQAAQADTQGDCGVAATNFSANSAIETSGTLASNPSYGQADSLGTSNGTGTAPTANASGNVAYNKAGTNGCVYPSNVPTLFNQLDAAGKTWKGYAQDLHNQPGRDDGPCGYPGTATNTPNSTTLGASATAGPVLMNTPKSYPGVASFTGVQAAGNDAAGNAGAKEDGYVAKHFPMPWFHSLIDGTTTPANGGTDCDSNHVSNLDDQNVGLVHDLASAATTPNFSWITPNNCSDAHDATCKGNNLSGAFLANGDPNYSGVSPAFDPQNTTPVNYTGGLYASDLFLKWYVPLIEQSAAFKDGGLIDVTFDEGNPAFVNSSFNNANDPAYAPGGAVTPGVSDTDLKAAYLAASNAGQNINGVDQSTEPTGPNTPVTTGGTCTATPCPGPGNNAFIHRTPSSTTTHTVTNTLGSATIGDQSIAPADPGRSVTGTGIPANSFVGPESNTGPLFPTVSAGAVTAGSFTLVDANGNAVPTTAVPTTVVLGAQDATPGDKNYDPLLDTTDFTPGGGDTGSVLISPFITPGTTSTKFYNHYSWLRSMEDIFDVNQGSASTALSPGAGSISTGLDNAGHLGYAAQAGLAPFGSDVFNNAAGSTSAPTPPASLPEADLAVGLPVLGLLAGGWVLHRRRRRPGTVVLAA